MDKIWEALWGQFVANWNAVSQGPLAFALLLIVAVVIACVVVELFHRESTKTLEARYQFAKDRADQYEKKLGGASPTEAAGEINELKKRLLALEPRHLTTNQQNMIVGELQKQSASGLVTVLHDMSSADGAVYAAEFRHLLSGIAGWDVRNASVLAPSRPPSTGVGIGVADIKNPPAYAVALGNALTSSGVPFNFFQDSLPIGGISLLITHQIRTG